MSPQKSQEIMEGEITTNNTVSRTKMNFEMKVRCHKLKKRGAGFYFFGHKWTSEIHQCSLWSFIFFHSHSLCPPLICK